MAGSPIRRSKRCLDDAMRALTEGRTDDAKRALADLQRTLRESGLPQPEMPREIAELWVQITEPLPPRRSPLNGSTKLSDKARNSLLEAGELAAQRLCEVMQDERLWGYTGIFTFEQQHAWINLALQRGFGSMAAGAQKVELPLLDEPAPGQQQIGSTLQLLVRAKQERSGEVIEGSAEDAA